MPLLQLRWAACRFSCCFNGTRALDAGWLPPRLATAAQHHVCRCHCLANPLLRHEPGWPHPQQILKGAAQYNCLVFCAGVSCVHTCVCVYVCVLCVCVRVRVRVRVCVCVLACYLSGERQLNSSPLFSFPSSRLFPRRTRVTWTTCCPRRFSTLSNLLAPSSAPSFSVGNRQ